LSSSFSSSSSSSSIGAVNIVNVTSSPFVSFDPPFSSQSYKSKLRDSYRLQLA
jgi:hypothetical protein